MDLENIFGHADFKGQYGDWLKVWRTQLYGWVRILGEWPVQKFWVSGLSRNLKYVLL